MQQIAPYTVKTATRELRGAEADAFPGQKTLLRTELVADSAGTQNVQVYGTEVLIFNPSSLTFVLVNAVKELDKENATIKNELADLKNEFATFKARLEAIENK